MRRAVISATADRSRTPRAWGLLGVLVLGCGAKPEAMHGSAPSVAPRAAPTASSPTAGAPSPAAAPVDAGIPAPVAPPSEWFAQIVDYHTFMSANVSVFVRPTGIAILATPGSILTSDWILRGSRGWSHEAAAEGIAVGATFDGSGTPWVVSADREARLWVQRGSVAERTAIRLATDYEDRAQIAVGAGGAPHLCVATDQANQSSHPAGRALSYATKLGARWKLEKLPGRGLGCTIAVEGGRVFVSSDDGVIVGRAGAWQLEPLGGPTRVARAPDGMIVAVTERRRELRVARYRAGAWTPSVLVADTGGAIGASAFTVDARGRVHAVFVVRDASNRDELRYVVEGGAAPSRIAVADAGMGLAIAVDEHDAPHIAFSPEFAPVANTTVQYVRRRVPEDPVLDRPARDADGLIAACARLVADQLGAEPRLTERDQRSAQRLCDAFKDEPVAVAELAQRCSDGALAACLVGGAMAGRSGMALTTLAIVDDACSARPCFSTQREDNTLGWFLPKVAPDAEQSRRLLERACALGERGACFYQAWRPDAAFDALAALCSPALPIACAAALPVAPSKDPAAAPALRALRDALEPACKDSRRPIACGALAYMKEVGLGGAVNRTEALRHHVRACQLHLATSCARLLVGPLGRPSPPKGIEAEALEALLSGACERRYGDACLALAAAHERGWVVARDRARARAILSQACEETRVDKACKKLGKPTPHE